MFVSLVIISVFIAIILNYYGIQVTPLAMAPSHDPDPNPSHDPNPNPSHPPPLLRHTDLPHHHLVTLPLPLSPTLPLPLTLSPTLPLPQPLTLTPHQTDLTITEMESGDFSIAWIKFDPDNTAYIPVWR